MERYEQGVLTGNIRRHEGVMMIEENGKWVKYEDMIHEVRHLLRDIGGVGDNVTDKDLENYFTNNGFCD